MTLVVRDEADILALQLRYHRQRGVDFFLVLDHASQDATPEILKHYERLGWLRWFRTDALRRDQGRWVTALARRACLEHQADWVINNDADEFWWCDTQTDLKAVLARVPLPHRLMYAPRTNFWAPNQENWWQQTYRQVKAHNFLREPLSGKICHRAEADIVVHHGNHSVHPMHEGDIWPEQPLEIFHFPVRSWPQFESKVRNGGRSWAANASLSPAMGRGKKYLYQRYLTGELKGVYKDWQWVAQEENRVRDTRFLEFVEGMG